MPKRFYKHKTLLDEQISPRQFFPRLNERFDVKHIKHDLNLASLPDPAVYELAVSQGRIILTKNVKDFRPLLQADSPGIIGIPARRVVRFKSGEHFRESVNDASYAQR